MRVLITGASGAVGEALARALTGRHELRGLARDPARVSRSLGLDVVRGDALSGEALEGVEAAYYLIHSMEPALAQSFQQRDRVAAERFAQEAASAGVRRIIYLGGLHRAGAAASAHLQSRSEVEAILMGALPDSVALRASLVIGGRSRSFRAIVRLIERLPAIPLPPWRRYRTQPIDERDAIAYLAAAAETAGAGGKAFDIAGPELLSYGEMIGRIASLLLLERPLLRLPLDPRALVSAFAARASGESHELLGPLMGSLRGDLIAEDAPARAAFGIGELHGFDAAVEHALREWESLEPLGAR